MPCTASTPSIPPPEGQALPVRRRTRPRIASLIEGLMRVFHALNGASRAIGLDAEKAITHRLEDGYQGLLDIPEAYAPGLVDLSLQAVDLINACVAARGRGPARRASR